MASGPGSPVADPATVSVFQGLSQAAGAHG
jgi:hypothetical protein